MSNELIENKSLEVPFWGSDPNILLNPAYLTELFPVIDMTMNEKFNAISRSMIVLSLLLFLVTKQFRYIIIGIITLAIIWLIHSQYTENDTEPFVEALPKKDIPSDLFAETTEENPLQNVMLNSYDKAADKKPAPASYTETTQSEILKHTKNMIDKMSPEQPKISEKLFKSLEDNLAFEQSMRPFHSNPATTIPNDQQAFTEFCYGSMISCKEGNSFACERNLPRHINL